MTIAQRCRIHAEKMSDEGWHVTANVLWTAAEEIDRLTPQPTISVGLISDGPTLCHYCGQPNPTGLRAGPSSESRARSRP